MEPESREEAFDRGMEAGRVAEQLQEHSTHLSRINGSVERFGTVVKDLTLAVNSLQTEGRNDRKALAETALAVQKSNDENWRALQHRFSVALYLLCFLLIVLIAVGVYLAATS